MSGLAFDGDADRVLAVDDTGRIIDGRHTYGDLCPVYERNRHSGA